MLITTVNSQIFSFGLNTKGNCVKLINLMKANAYGGRWLKMTG